MGGHSFVSIAFGHREDSRVSHMNPTIKPGGIVQKPPPRRIGTSSGFCFSRALWLLFCKGSRNLLECNSSKQASKLALACTFSLRKDPVERGKYHYDAVLSCLSIGLFLTRGICMVHLVVRRERARGAPKSLCDCSSGHYHNHTPLLGARVGRITFYWCMLLKSRYSDSCPRESRLIRQERALNLCIAESSAGMLNTPKSYITRRPRWLTR